MIAKTLGVLLFSACIVMVWVCYRDLVKHTPAQLYPIRKKKMILGISWITTFCCLAIISDILFNTFGET